VKKSRFLYAHPEANAKKLAALDALQGKPKFNALHARVRAVRLNRQRQELLDNSPRLDSMERRLTGMVKTMAGQAANQLVAAYPKHVFVIEALDLRGCRGSKRFAFKALHHSLTVKAPTQEVNCAFSSQACPSCGFASRANRNGIKFHCRCCGRISHADVVGGLGLLGRSGDKQIRVDDHYTSVGAILRERYLARRRTVPRDAHNRARTVEPGAHRRPPLGRHSPEVCPWPM